MTDDQSIHDVLQAWREDNRLDRWDQIIANTIGKSLTNTFPDHSASGPVTTLDAFHALESTTYCRMGSDQSARPVPNRGQRSPQVYGLAG